MMSYCILATRWVVFFAEIIVARPLHPVLNIVHVTKKYFQFPYGVLFSHCELFFYSQRLIVNSHPESEQETIWELQLSSVVFVERGLKKKMIIHVVSLDDNSSGYSFFFHVMSEYDQIVLLEGRLRKKRIILHVVTL